MSTFSPPPAPEGSVQQQLQRQYAYIFQMHQQLNLALEGLEGAAAPTSPAARQVTAEERQQYRNLKSLVVRTADQVQREMDSLSLRLEGEYVASGSFGSYIEQLSSHIEANPEALSQYYRFAADLKSNVAAVDEAFSTWKTGTQGYIRTGIVHYEDDLPVYGVAVGQNLTVREVDGEVMVEPNNFRATFTAARLSFWQDETEVAYLSNNRLYITNITVLGDLTLGRWRVTGVDGLAWQWIGG